MHRVVDRHQHVRGAARRVDVDSDVLVGIVSLEVKQLGHDQVGDRVIDGGTQEDDPVIEEATVDVESPLSSGRLLDNGRYHIPVHSGPSGFDRRRHVPYGVTVRG